MASIQAQGHQNFLKNNSQIMKLNYKSKKPLSKRRNNNNLKTKTLQTNKNQKVIKKFQRLNHGENSLNRTLTPKTVMMIMNLSHMNQYATKCNPGRHWSIQGQSYRK